MSAAKPQKHGGPLKMQRDLDRLSNPEHLDLYKTPAFSKTLSIHFKSI